MVCFIGYLSAACAGILWKVVVLVVLCLVIISFYHHLCFHLFLKWEPGSKCWIYLETHHLLNSIIFIFFPFEWHTNGNEEMVCQWKLSPSNVSVVWKGKFTKVLGQYHSPLLLQITIIKVSWSLCVYQPPFQNNWSECSSHIFPRINGKTEINTSVLICTVLSCLHKLWKMGAEFLVSRVRKLHIHSNKSNLGISLCLSICVPFRLTICDTKFSSPIINNNNNNNKTWGRERGQERRGDFTIR